MYSNEANDAIKGLSMREVFKKTFVEFFEHCTSFILGENFSQNSFISYRSDHRLSIVLPVRTRDCDR